MREYIGHRRRFCVALGERSVPNRSQAVLYVMVVRSSLPFVLFSPSSTQRQIRDNRSYATYASGKDGVHSPKMSFRFRSVTADLFQCFAFDGLFTSSLDTANASGYVR